MQKTGRWDIYIKQVLQEKRPGFKFGPNGKRVMCDIICHLEDELSKATLLVNEHSDKKTITWSDIDTAVRIRFDAEMANYAAINGNKALKRFKVAKCVDHTNVDNKSECSPEKGPRTKIAKLTFSVPKAENGLRMLIDSSGFELKLDSGAPVYLAAVLEYFCAEILDGAHSKSENKTHITPDHIHLSIQNDPELKNALSLIDIVDGEVHLRNVVETHVSDKVSMLQRGDAEGYKKGKRHRKILRDNIHGITEGDVRRLFTINNLLHPVYVKMVSKECYEELKDCMVAFLQMILRNSIAEANSQKRKTVRIDDLKRSVKGIVQLYYKNPESLDIYSSTIAFRKTPFRRLVREIGQEYMHDLRFSPLFMKKLQRITETYLIDTIMRASFLVRNGKRVKLTLLDIQLVRHIKGYQTWCW